MSETNSWDAVVAGFRAKPKYGLVLGLAQIVVQALVSAGGKQGDIIWHAGAFLVVTLLFIVFIASPANTTGKGDPAPVVSAARQGLRRALEAASESIARGLVKQRMHVELVLLSYDAANAQAEFQLSVGYDIVNDSTEGCSFTVHAQVECRSRNDVVNTGRLLVRTGAVASVDKRILFSRLQPGDSASIQDLFQEPVGLSPGEHHVQWSCDRYSVGIPYAEFWATAHPLVDMSVRVDLAAAAGELKALADCYRAEPDSFARSEAVGRYRFEAAGPFLPYQGIAVRVIRTRQGGNP
jgi:hypothetical protein